MLYRNTKTGAVFDSSVPVKGENIEPYKKEDDVIADIKAPEKEMSKKAAEETEFTEQNIPDDLAKLTVDELKQVAENSQIDLAGATKKKDIIKAIMDAEGSSK